MRLLTRLLLLPLPTLVAVLPASANVVVDWNQIAGRTLGAAQVAGNPRARAMAMVNVAMFDAVATVDGRYTPVVARAQPPSNASPAAATAAAAAAAHALLVQVAPSQKDKLDEALATTLGGIADERARSAGATLGARVGGLVFADRVDDALSAPDDYRPFTSPGVWVPTASPISPEYARAKLWGTVANSHYRPEAPPALESAQWARDYNEVRQLGGRNSKARTQEQTDAVRFWTQPALGSAADQVARQVVEMKKPSLSDTARFYAHLQMAVANTFMADWDAKFHYNFWRPVTAIRNGDRDNNDATEREATWTPLNATPMHPEYPSQASMLASVINAVVERHFGADVGPFVMVEPTSEGKVKRAFPNVAAIAREMTDVRIWGGVHFRSSLDVSARMGQRIAEDLAVTYMKPR
jgi:hypothetical protein